MSAREKSQLIDISTQKHPKKLGIIAGAGVLPAQLFDACLNLDIEPIVVGFQGYTDQVTPHKWGRIGASARIINYFKSEDVSDIVMIGAVKRPSLLDLWPDWITFKFFFKAWIRSFGDSYLLSEARHELESMGFKIHGVHKFLPELLMTEGVQGYHVPRVEHQIDVQVGLKAARDLGRDDIGQAVIVKNGEVIAREDKRGTSAMIKQHGQEGAVLVKMCKPQQDLDLDLPTLGPETVQLCAEKGMVGVVGQAKRTLFAERTKAVKLADQHDIFLMGVTIEEGHDGC